MFTSALCQEPQGTDFPLRICSPSQGGREELFVVRDSRSLEGSPWPNEQGTERA